MAIKPIFSSWTSALIALALLALSLVTGITPAHAYAGTLENGNLAYAASEFNKGSACDYLPGYESGYDAWHLVLTSRGATFQASPTNPKISVNLNIVFMRTDGTKYVIKSGALVQFGKGAYVYTLTKDKDRIVQVGSLATINSSDSGIRLSHTCPGAGEATFTPTITPSPTPTPSPSPTPTPNPSPSLSACQLCVIKSFAKPNPRPSESPGPGYKGLEPSPTPSPTTSVRPTPTATQSQRPIPTTSPSATQTAQPTPTPTREQRPELPQVPPVEDPKNVIFVKPNEPIVVTSKELTGRANTPIEIITEPIYGTVEVQSNGNLIYTSNLSDPKSLVVEVVEYKFTNLSGAVVIARKEFVLEQSGDVPSIIQTGELNFLPFIGLIFVLVLLISSYLVIRAFKPNYTWARRNK